MRTRPGASSPGIGPCTEASLAVVRREWADTPTALQVRDADRPMDLMLNRWLLDQALGLAASKRARPSTRRAALGLPRPAAGRDVLHRRAAGSRRRAAPGDAASRSSRRVMSSTGWTTEGRGFWMISDDLVGRPRDERPLRDHRRSRRARRAGGLPLWRRCSSRRVSTGYPARPCPRRPPSSKSNTYVETGQEQYHELPLQLLICRGCIPSLHPFIRR